MLAQLVCLDRRYQRMNCFNMRELQALLKEKYYPDLVTSFDYRSSILTAIDLRHKTNDLSSIDPKSLIFLNNNLTTSTFLKTQSFWSTQVSVVPAFATFFGNVNPSYILFSRVALPANPLTIISFANLNYLVRDTFLIILNNVFLFIKLVFDMSALELKFEPILVINNIVGTLTLRLSFLTDLITPLTTSMLLLNLYTVFTYSSIIHLNAIRIKVINLVYIPEVTNVLYNKNEMIYNSEETVVSSRALRFSNPIFKYDYKLGNYLTKDMISNFPNLLVSQTQVTGGIKKSSWYHSFQFLELLNENIQNYINTFTAVNNTPLVSESERAHPGSMGAFYALFHDLNLSSDFINSH